MHYVIYQDHVGWVITTKADYGKLRSIYRALAAKTWGEFMELLPTTERDRFLKQNAGIFGSDFLPESGAAPEVQEGDVIAKDSLFSPSQLPGFDEGDYPFWPAEDSRVSDGNCRQAYERFGRRQTGFVHTFHHLRSELIPDLREWLTSEGHDLEVRANPGTK